MAEAKFRVALDGDRGFYVSKRLLRLDSPSLALWMKCPGYREELIGATTWIIVYMIDEEEVSVGIMFSTERCARIGMNYLVKQGFSPMSYRALKDTLPLRREVIANLPW